MDTLLSVQEIHTYYGDSYVLQGMSVELNAGEALGILGRNGMGLYKRNANYRNHSFSKLGC